MKITSAQQRKYSIVPYQEAWLGKFEEIKQEVLPIFGDIAEVIEHVGNTSIVGMSGKPTIDVLVVVKDISFINSLNGDMAVLGYQALGEYVSAGGRLFAKEVDGERLVNIHCFESDHPKVKEMQSIRDFLRSHPDESRAYADLKSDLYNKYPNDYSLYRRGKDPYLTELKVRAMNWFLG